MKEKKKISLVTYVLSLIGMAVIFIIIMFCVLKKQEAKNNTNIDEISNQSSFTNTVEKQSKENNTNSFEIEVNKKEEQGYRQKNETSENLSKQEISTNENTSRQEGNTEKSENKSETKKETIASNKISDGKYERKKTGNTEGYLEVSKSTNNSFEFSIECLYGTQNEYGPNIGTLEGTAKKISDTKYIYTEKNTELDYEYKLYFEITGDKKITLNDECRYTNGESEDNYPMSGHNVTFEGEYTK